MHSVVSAQEAPPVVAGVDGSRTSTATIDLAVAEAVRHRAPLLIVHVWPGRYTGVFRGRGAVPSRADGRRLLDLSASRARLAAPDLPIGTELLDGGAANVLAGCSERARLIVVGHRDEVAGRPSWARRPHTSPTTAPVRSSCTAAPYPTRVP